MADELNFGIEQFKAGRKEEARRIFLKVIKEHENYTEAYMWLYKVAYNDTERMNILKRVLSINPIHEEALALYRQLNTPGEPSSKPIIKRPVPVKPAPAKPNTTNTVIGIAALLAICCICFFIFTYSDWGGKTEKDYKTSAYIMCQLYVENSLKSPSSADFPHSGEANIVETSPNIFEIRSYVDAQNSFGAMLRNYYFCKIQYVGQPEDDEYAVNNWVLTELNFIEP